MFENKQNNLHTGSVVKGRNSDRIKIMFYEIIVYYVIQKKVQFSNSSPLLCHAGLELVLPQY